MRLVVLGDPIDHSLSPAIQLAAFAASGLVCTYVRRRVDANGLAEAVGEIRAGELDGANVTMPHKTLAASLADRLAATSVRAGAVNTFVRVGNEAVGHNTDVPGIRKAWSEAELPTGGPVLILGAGGAAAAAVLALEGMQLHVATRRPGAATELLTRVGVDAAERPWGSPLADAVVVNATPLGMGGEPLPSGVVEGAAALFDMAYGAEPTPAVASALAVGLPCVDGRRMLVHQAAISFELWTGQQAPLHAMATALDAPA